RDQGWGGGGRVERVQIGRRDLRAPDPAGRELPQRLPQALDRGQVVAGHLGRGRVDRQGRTGQPPDQVVRRVERLEHRPLGLAPGRDQLEADRAGVEGVDGPLVAAEEAVGERVALPNHRRNQYKRLWPDTWCCSKDSPPTSTIRTPRRRPTPRSGWP